MTANPRLYPVLVVEDNNDDFLFLEQAIVDASLPLSLYRVSDGASGIKYLNGEAEYSDRDRYPCPSLLVTNMKLPYISGVQIVEWVRQQPKWRSLPIIAMSSSGEPKEVERLHALKINAYCVKVGLFEDLVNALQHILAQL